MNEERSGRYAVPAAVLGGVLVALVVAVVVVVVARDDGTPATTAATTTTETPATTITTGPTTTTSTATTTTTLPTFAGDTAAKEGDVVGEPGGQLQDVRWGTHPGFTRIVFDFTGTGIPAYRVRYAPGPFTTVAGDPVPVAGSRFLLVTLFPAMRWDVTDPDDQFPVYAGPERMALDTGSVTEVVFLEDFEANMEWVIGVTGQRGFTVGTLSGPPRVYVDVAD